MDEMAVVLGVALGVAFLLGLPAWNRAKDRERQAKRASVGPIVAQLGPIILCDDPLRLEGPVGPNAEGNEREEFPITQDVRATVDSAGSITATRGRDLAAKAWGTAFFGPVGLLGAGNAKDRVHDSRELYLVVESETWAYTRPIDPNSGAEARNLAAQINLAARKAEPNGDSSSARGDSLDRLERLAKLRADGTLTPEEFQLEKAKVLRNSA